MIKIRAFPKNSRKRCRANGLETTWRQCWSSGRKNGLRNRLRIPYCSLKAGFLRVLPETNEIHEVRTFSPCKAFFFVFVFVVVVVFLVTWKLLWIQSNQCYSKKMIIPSVWNWIRRFEHFQRGLYFSDNCVFDLWVDFVSSASPSFAGLN